MSPDHGKSMKINENQWKSKKINENQWKSMKTNEKQWKSMKIKENQWKSMKINENQWKSMKIYQFRSSGRRWSTLQPSIIVLIQIPPRFSASSASLAQPAQPSQLSWLIRFGAENDRGGGPFGETSRCCTSGVKCSISCKCIYTKRTYLLTYLKRL